MQVVAENVYILHHNVAFAHSHIKRLLNTSEISKALIHLMICRRQKLADTKVRRPTLAVVPNIVCPSLLVLISSLYLSKALNYTHYVIQMSLHLESLFE